MSKRHSWWTPGHGAWLKRAIARYGSQSKLLENIHLSRASLIEILAGRSAPKRETLELICGEIGADLDEIIGLDGEVTPDDAQRNSVAIREIDMSYGLGATNVEDVPITEMVRYFPTDWLRQFTSAAPDQLFFAHGTGDSMMPTILDGDIILVDTTQDTPRQADRIWVLAWGGMGMVKRLRGRPDGGISILSDNPAVPPEIAYDGEIHIVGRVVAVVRKM